MLHGGASLIKKTCEHYANDGVEYTVKRKRKAAVTANVDKLQMKRQCTTFPKTKTKTKTRQESKKEGRKVYISKARASNSFLFQTNTQLTYHPTNWQHCQCRPLLQVAYLASLCRIISLNAGSAGVEPGFLINFRVSVI
jgi:hypothetical protein